MKARPVLIAIHEEKPMINQNCDLKPRIYSLNKSPFRVILLVCVLFFLPLHGHSQNKNQIFKVKYLSKENVYLDAGSDAGLRVGDIMVVRKKDKVIAKLEIVFIAKQSASCKIITKINTVIQGDKVLLVKRKKRAVESMGKIDPGTKGTQKSEVTARSVPAREMPKRKKKRNKTRISGSASMQYYQLRDHSERKMHFEQPTVRFRLRAKQIWGKDYNFSVRTRSRYYQRSTSYNTLPREEWRNRIYEVSFDYSNESALFNYQIGRIISNKFSGVGYIDGAQLRLNLNSKFTTGIFAGTQPQWQYSSFQTSMEKYGGFINFVDGKYGSRRLETTLAAAGEYHSGMVSREFLYLQNSYNDGGRWNLYQSLEIDINRDWRKKVVQESLSLSSLYLSLRYKISRNVATTFSYDNRKNYYSYDTRTLADSLFDDALRHGFRSSLSIKLNKTLRFYSNLGVRKRETDNAATVSFAGGLNKSNFFGRWVNLNIRFSGFSNLYARGFNPSVRLGKTFRHGHTLNLSYGNYNYILDSTNKNRMNQWVRLYGVFEMKYRLFLSGEFGYNWGDDSTDHRILGELGYRF
ncbi:MAG: hypothetical protein DWQ05_14840 [Calditrichaeota bacterium]|nr:MAG: hypothetical protein DWQ05_14840 [Calditrichota bacterium]